jgi:hypothetical protein
MLDHILSAEKLAELRTAYRSAHQNARLTASRL